MIQSLRMAAFQERSRVNGPGQRSVLWVQGCCLGCPACFNPEFQDPEGGWIVSPEYLIDRILAVPDTEGVTFSGGEPFDQAEALAVIAAAAQAAGRSVLVFTGYEYHYLGGDVKAGAALLLAHTDLLVAGPFDETRPRCDHTLLSSRNQELRFLSDRYQDCDFRTSGRRAEFRIQPNGITEISGFPPINPGG